MAELLAPTQASTHRAASTIIPLPSPCYSEYSACRAPCLCSLARSACLCRLHGCLSVGVRVGEQNQEQRQPSHALCSSFPLPLTRRTSLGHAPPSHPPSPSHAPRTGSFLAPGHVCICSRQHPLAPPPPCLPSFSHHTSGATTFLYSPQSRPPTPNPPPTTKLSTTNSFVLCCQSRFFS